MEALSTQHFDYLDELAQIKRAERKANKDLIKESQRWEKRGKNESRQNTRVAYQY